MASRMHRDMKRKRVHFDHHHRGSRHGHLSRNKFMQLPYPRVYKPERNHTSDRGRKFLHGRPFLRVQTNQQAQPHIQQEFPTNKGLGSGIKKLLNIIIKDLQPLSSVNIEAPLSQSSIRCELQSFYRTKRVEVQRSVNKAHNLVLSAELWSSNKNTFYLTVAGHLINENWELKSYVLDTAHLIHKSTAESVVEQLLRISKEWNITEKTQFVVTNVDGIKRAQNNIRKWTFIPCFAFTLDKVVRETLSDWELLLRKCQQIVAFFHQSDEASQHLQKHRISLKLQSRELTQSSGLKWLPTFYMLKTILEQWPAIFEVFVDKRVDLCLNENERKIVDQIVKVLDVLKEATLKVGRQGFISISNIIPVVQMLQERLRNLGMMENRIAQKLSEKCDYHIGKINQILWFRVCTALDPQYKTSVLRDSSIEDVKAEIKRQMRESKSVCHKSRSDESVLLNYWEMKDISGSTLEFWRNLPEEFRKLSSVARKNLSVVSTVIPMENVHQMKESQIINRRNCLEPENLNMILFLNSNL
ncbi:zinc finger BED domain-containing protein 4 isoform X2 [Danio rerio]|uniref:Zinc finger BED domain-containing protein 4 isoform X2 n=1 Tax=Danio rerio TaxID=7955 RepID=A0AC58GYV2_DANRE